MFRHLMTLSLLAGMMPVSGAARTSADDKKEPEVKKGTVVGVVTNKTEKSIEVKADGEEKARVYVPQWVGGLPAQGVAAVALNVTVTDPKGPGHLTVSPSGLQPSATSNLNFTTGQTVANAVIVPVGPDGRISVRNGAWGAADVIVDVTGYYSADGKAAYLPEEPRRLYDSRPWGPLSGRNFDREGVWTSGRALEALVLNTTVTNPQGSGHLAVAPEPGNLGGARPTPPDSSVLNWTKGATVSNLVQADFRNVEYVDIWNLGWEPTDLIVDLVGMYDRS